MHHNTPRQLAIGVSWPVGGAGVTHRNGPRQINTRWSGWPPISFLWLSPRSTRLYGIFTVRTS